MFNVIHESFIQAVYRVAGIVAGNQRAEAGLWYLMGLVKATDLERSVLTDLLIDREATKDDQKSTS